MNKKSGFTLIEVLTVIMIIAILASIILVSLDTARERARDVTIQNQVGQLRSLAEALYTFENHYDELAAAKTGAGEASPEGEALKYKRIMDEVSDMGSEGGLVTNFSTGNRSYCSYAQLVRNDENAFCVDSTGNAVTGLLTEIAASCGGDDALCEGGTTTAPEPEPEP